MCTKNDALLVNILAEMAAAAHRDQVPKLSPTMQQMRDGKGFTIGEIPFREICEDGYCDIDSCEELQTVVMSYLAKDKSKNAIFETAILGNDAYPKRITFGKYVGKKARRFQTKIAKPTQPGSTKTKVDNSPESRLYRFCEKFVDVVINKDSDVPFMLSEVNILESGPFASNQTRHHDFNKYSNPMLINMPNSSFVFAIGERASMHIWPNTQDITHAAHSAEESLIPPNKILSEVRKILKNSPKQIDINDCRMQEVYFGVNEFLGFLDNTIHGGAPNHMNKTLFRLHFYVVRKDAVAPTKYTFFPADVVWDITRNGAPKPEGIYISDIKKNPKLAKNFIFGENDDDFEEVDQDEVESVDEDEEDDEPAAPARAQKRGRSSAEASSSGASEAPLARKVGRPSKKNKK